MQMTAAKTPRVTSKNLLNKKVMNRGLLPIRLPAGEAAQLSRDFILSRVWAAASRACQTIPVVHQPHRQRLSRRWHTDQARCRTPRGPAQLFEAHRILEAFHGLHGEFVGVEAVAAPLRFERASQEQCSLAA
jgi:hypothetical protein